ncbi:MAG: NDP-sugar synthase [Haloarculaceae archaeon]
MEAVVLAGGYATRLWPITKHRPKMFLPVGETTVIDRILDQLERDDRVETVYVSTNERFAGDFEAYLEESDFVKPVLSVEDTSEEDEKFGVVGALAQLVEREGVDDDLLVVAGDNLMGFDLRDFLDHFEEKGTATLAAYDVGSREKAKSYGLVTLEDGRVVDFQEKPEDPRSTLVSIACYALPRASLRFREYLAADQNPDEPGWFLQWLQSREPVYAFTFEDAWYDIGTPESYLEAVEWGLGGGSVVADSATLADTEVGGNVHVMADARVEGSSIERSVVFPGATILDCEVHDSIVDEGAHIENLDLAGALVGAHTRLVNRND